MHYGRYHVERCFVHRGGAVGSTISDGTVTWTVRRYALDFPRFGAFNKAETFTSSGSFVAPVTGTYRITLQGGGGGGGGASSTQYGYRGGGGGGEGGHLEFYEKLTAGQTYSYVIGAGGAGGDVSQAGSAGGSSTITINSSNYLAEGGAGGDNYGAINAAGIGGRAMINNVVVGRGNAGTAGGTELPTTHVAHADSAIAVLGGSGGGAGGTGLLAANGSGILGGGGVGGNIAGSPSTLYSGGNGGDGYITFEYCNV